MKKSIIFFTILIMFASLSFERRRVIRFKQRVDPYKAFIKQKVELLGLKTGKINKIGDVYIIIVNNFSPKTKALRLTKPFRSFSLKVRLLGMQPGRRGIIIVNCKPVAINKNLKIVLSKKALLGLNFIVDTNNMPQGIVIQK